MQFPVIVHASRRVITPLHFLPSTSTLFSWLSSSHVSSMKEKSRLSYDTPNLYCLTFFQIAIMTIQTCVLLSFPTVSIISLAKNLFSSAAQTNLCNYWGWHWFILKICAEVPISTSEPIHFYWQSRGLLTFLIVHALQSALLSWQRGTPQFYSAHFMKLLKRDRNPKYLSQLSRFQSLLEQQKVIRRNVWLNSSEKQHIPSPLKYKRWIQPQESLQTTQTAV